MRINDAIKEINGFSYMMNSLNILSSAGRRHLYALPFLTQKEEIEKAFTEIQWMNEKLEDPKLQASTSILPAKLSHLKDIKNTLLFLKQRNTLNDIELFEIKHFALLAESVRTILKEIDFSLLNIPELTDVIGILDPENKRIPHFYIYDQYSEELTFLRSQIKEKKAQQGDSTDIEELQQRALDVEDMVRRDLSKKLSSHADKLHQALEALAHLDVLLAKTEQARIGAFAKPALVDGSTSYVNLFHPEIKARLLESRKTFQPVSIVIPQGPSLITGANMSGKSVLLHSVALAQVLAQFGFYVPAEKAEIAPVDTIILSIDEKQDALKGLSSFAAEMIRLNQLTDSIQKGSQVLALIDELARTTNPTEGKAIVSGVLDFLIEHKVRSLITTHYSDIPLDCRRLRVKGFTEKGKGESITVENINEFMDYSLEETTENKVPHEAIRVAEIIGVNEDIIKRTRYYLNTQ